MEEASRYTPTIYASTTMNKISGCRMLKARLPTQKELTDLYREVENLRKDKKLKDDTIKFLQKEKEAIMRELKHYEQLCDGVVTDITSHRQLEADNNQLQADILHLKDIIRRQNSLLRNTGNAGSQHMDRQLVSRLAGNLLDLLDDVRTPTGDQVYNEIAHQKEQLERASPKKGETTWHFLEIIDRAMIELKSVQKKKDAYPAISKSATMRYSQGNPTLSQSFNGPIQSMSEPTRSVSETPPPMKQAQQSNLMTTSSMSMANLSSGLLASGSEQLVPAAPTRKRSGNSGKLGRIGRGMERSRSAPILSASVGQFTPRPPPTPAPPNIQNIYRSTETTTTVPINQATVSMKDLITVRIPGMTPHPPSSLTPRPPNAPPPSNIKNIYENSRPVNTPVSLLDTLSTHPISAEY